MRENNPFRSHQERGSALMAAVMISMLLIAGMAWFYNWGWERSRAEVRQNGGQYAMQYADSGINSTAVWLKGPSLKTLLPVGSSTTLSLPMENGRCDVAIYRRSPDIGLIDAYATGYYLLNSGSAVDPVTNQNAQIAVINAKFRISNASDYLIAVSSALFVTYGTNAGAGIIYAQDLTFDPPGTGDQTSIGTALYSNTVFPSSAPPFVTFTQTPAAAQQLPYPPSFVTLNGDIRNLYSTSSGGGVAPPFAGVVSAPPTSVSPSHVYFVNGDLSIGDGDNLMVDGVYVIYVTGTVTIHNSILLNTPQSWVAILSEQDIDIAPDAPDTLTLNGNYLMNGSLIAKMPTSGNPRANGTFTLNGGIISMNAISVANVYLKSRTYTYASTTDPDLFLPNSTNMLQYTILVGRNNRR